MREHEVSGEEFDLTLGIRDALNDQLPARPLTLARTTAEALACQVVKTESGWIQIRDFTSRQQGWVKEGFDSASLPLKKIMPELSFAEGLGGYLSARTDLHSSGMPTDFSALVKNALQHFEELTRGDDKFPAAVGNELVGILQVAAHDPSTSDLDSASKVFGRAADLAPASGEAVNLAAITRTRLAIKLSGNKSVCN